MKILLALIVAINLFAQVDPRVIALSPAINEIIFALGKGDTIVANTIYSNYPEEAKNIPKVGGFFEVSLEKVIALKPDMVMLQVYDTNFVKNLEKLNIKYMTFETNKIEDILNGIEKIGKFYNVTQKSQEVIDKINKSLKSLENIVQDKKILMVIGASTNLSKPIFVVGHNLYLEDIILKSNNKNAYDIQNFTQPTINLETLIKLNPDIVLLFAPYLNEINATKEELLKKWQTIPITAAKKDTIYVINKEYVGIPSNRVEFFINDFKKALQDASSK